MKRIAIWSALMGTLIVGGNVWASSANPLEGFKLGGVVYYDIRGPLNDSGMRTQGAFSEFDFRRSYFTVDYTISEDFAVRYRTDVDRKGADDKLRPFVKALYLQWKNLIPDAKLVVGMAGTPTWSTYSEKYWGYRGVEKTLLDNYKGATGRSIDVSSADVGVALKGSLAEKKVAYHLMVSNGDGYSHGEDNKYKKVHVQGAVKPVDGLVLVALVEFEPQNADDNNLLLKGFAGYQNQDAAVGLEYFTYDNKAEDLTSTGLSVFGRYNVQEDLTPFARVDIMDPDTDADENETTLVIAGIDYRPHPKVHVMPNLHYYINPGDADADVMAALTFQYGM